jgi:hypothetical protein
MADTPWVSADQLQLALGPSTFLAIFDDGGGVPNADAIALVLRAAHADVLRYAYRGYDGPVPDEPTDELLFLELDFAQARALLRGDTYTRESGRELFASARETAKDIASSLQRGSADQPNPTPALAALDVVPPKASAASMVSERDALPWTENAVFWRKEGKWWC